MLTAKEILRQGVQAFLAVFLTGTVIYLTIVGLMSPEIIAGLAGTAVGFYLAERKNNAERKHIEKLTSFRDYH